MDRSPGTSVGQIGLRRAAKDWGPGTAFLVTAILLASCVPVPAPIGGGTGKIAFSADDVSGVPDIFIANVSGIGAPVNLTLHWADDQDPAWSPDGSLIAFETNRDGNWEIYVMNSNGTGLVNLTNRPGDDLDPAWSPDGSRISFTSNRTGIAEVYVMSADGTGQTQVTEVTADVPPLPAGSPVYAAAPAWSPDAAQIAFSVVFADSSPRLYIVPSDASAAPVPVHSGGRIASGAAWSPDGAWLAFTDPPVQALIKRDLASGAEETLFVSGDLPWYPAWSPNGRLLAFAVSDPNMSDLWRVNHDGSGLAQITSGMGHASHPDWQP